MTSGKNLKKNADITRQYWKHILAVLVLKAVLLTILWYTFFRDEPKFDNKTAGQHIFGYLQHVSEPAYNLLSLDAQV